MSFPVGFLQGKEASLILRSWPRQYRVKVLESIASAENQSYLPQTKAFKALDQACVEWGHQLVVEIMPHNGEGDLVYPVEAMEAYIVQAFTLHGGSFLSHFGRCLGES